MPGEGGQYHLIFVLVKEPPVFLIITLGGIGILNDLVDHKSVGRKVKRGSCCSDLGGKDNPSNNLFHGWMPTHTILAFTHGAVGCERIPSVALQPLLIPLGHWSISGKQGAATDDKRNQKQNSATGVYRIISTNVAWRGRRVLRAPEAPACNAYCFK